MQNTVRSNKHLVGKHEQIWPLTGDNSLKKKQEFGQGMLIKCTDF